MRSISGRRRQSERAALPSFLDIERGSGPFLAVSVHAGHEVRRSLLPHLELTEEERLREEDPCTELWAGVCPNRIIARRSRFEVDLNRPATEALYLHPEQAFGLRVWRTPPDDESVAKTMSEYRVFYAHVRQALEDLEARYGKFVVFDLHSYNHRREGPSEAPADALLNPEVNVGTSSLDRGRWGRVVDRFVDDLRRFNFMGRQLDVRENVRFRGGHLCRWVHEQFPVTGCALAIEFKKFYMNEWTGDTDVATVEAIRAALASTLDGLREELARR